MCGLSIRSIGFIWDRFHLGQRGVVYYESSYHMDIYKIRSFIQLYVYCSNLRKRCYQTVTQFAEGRGMGVKLPSFKKRGWKLNFPFSTCQILEKSGSGWETPIFSIWFRNHPSSNVLSIFQGCCILEVVYVFWVHKINRSFCQTPFTLENVLL